MRIKYLLVPLFTIFLFISFTPKMSFAQDVSDEEVESNDIEIVETSDEVHIPDEEKAVPENDENEEATPTEQEDQDSPNDSDLDSDNNSDSTPEADLPEDELSEKNPTNEVETEQTEKAEGNESEEKNSDREIPDKNNHDEVGEEVNRVQIQSFDSLTINQRQKLTDSALSKGKRHDSVIELKQNLEKIGFRVPGNGTNFFGAQTEKKVREFQKYYGLEETGIVDGETINKIKIIATSPLQKGNRNQETIQLKKDLAFLGMPVPGSGTNLYGTQTESKVMEFQQKYDLIINGIADFITLDKIQDLILAPLSNGMRREDVKTLKQDLDKLGFTVPGNGTNLYGSQTEQKVKEFQSTHNLNVSGVVNESTISKMEEILNSPLQNGKRHQNVVQLKKDLDFLGLTVPGNGTNYFGAQTANKVKDFQRRVGLPVSGIADTITLEKIKEELNAPLSSGMRREDVKTLKQNLNKLGFTVPGNGTNFYGSQTEQKVKEFQDYYGIKSTGIVNDVTLNEIKSLLNTPLQNGKRHKDTVVLKNNLKTLGFTVPGNGTNLYGSQTERKIRDFQRYYSLAVNGIADEITLNKIQELLKSPLQSNKYHDDTVTLKINLDKLGFTVPGNQTRYFGTQTQRKVKDFQRHYGLAISGIADEVTLQKINTVLNSPLQNGKRHSNTVKLKSDLKKIGYVVPGNGTNLYGNQTERQVKAFQRDYNLPVSGIADEVTLAKIAELASKVKPSIKIFIDPGHGGKDPGARSNGYQEKTFVLDIALRINNHLKKYKGVEILLSRTTDEFLELSDRTQMANNWGADYFVSIHNNAFNGSAHGFESFIYNSPTRDERNKQNIIHDHIANNISERDRGKKERNFHVLRESNMSAILLEYLFIDNTSDRNRLRDSSYRDRLARLTAEGIAEAFDLKK